MCDYEKLRKRILMYEVEYLPIFDINIVVIDTPSGYLYMLEGISAASYIVGICCHSLEDAFEHFELIKHDFPCFFEDDINVDNIPVSLKGRC